MALNSNSKHGPSPIRWAGSKRHVVKQLAPLFVQSQRHYVEPFAGSAALFFSTTPKTATLGDLNENLINFYFQMRRNPAGIYRELLKLKRTKRTYYRIRNEFNYRTISDFRRAVFFGYLNRNCFNGIWRTNSSGAFNVPYASLHRSQYPSKDHFINVAKALECTDLIAGDFRTTLKNIDYENSIIYADPPYFSGRERVFVEYGEQSFDGSDLSDLVKLLKNADRHGAIIVLSYKSDEGLATSFPDWYLIEVEVTRNVGGFSGSRKKAKEILISNRDLRNGDCAIL